MKPLEEGTACKNGLCFFVRGMAPAAKEVISI